MSRMDVALVISMSNYGSPVVEECVRQFRTIVHSTDNISEEDDREETTQVFGLILGNDIVSNNNTLNTEFGSPYLLAHIVEKFLNYRNIIPKITDMF